MSGSLRIVATPARPCVYCVLRAEEVGESFPQYHPRQSLENATIKKSAKIAAVRHTATTTLVGVQDSCLKHRGKGVDVHVLLQPSAMLNRWFKYRWQYQILAS